MERKKETEKRNKKKRDKKWDNRKKELWKEKKERGWKRGSCYKNDNVDISMFKTNFTAVSKILLNNATFKTTTTTTTTKLVPNGGAASRRRTEQLYTLGGSWNCLFLSITTRPFPTLSDSYITDPIPSIPTHEYPRAVKKEGNYRGT